MKNRVKKHGILLVLALLFTAPGVAAYLFYQHPNWLAAHKTNRGTLLNAPIALDALNGHDKWKIIFWSPKSCKQECLKELDTLARVRLALGRRLYQVDQWLLLESEVSIDRSIESKIKEQDFHVSQLSVKDQIKISSLSPDMLIFIASPDNYLVLSYQSPLNPDDIYKDLKLLLNTAEHKNG